ncbi:Zinc finger protein [Plakobranchus ocellatus]|uniref:Zinc finger protein n=1 Tax=Plakobranchus ocellatus TaxID=259542 RepID=A0AAV4BUA7_9GAST|nr:Zinc finger protein [Plakobranchus ocellatus]
MLQFGNGKAVPIVTNRAALGDPKKTSDICVAILRGEIGGREVDVMQNIGCESVMVRKRTVGESQLTGTLTRAAKVLVRGIYYVVDYVDDLLVHTTTCEDQVRNLGELFMRLQPANFTVRPTKCVFGARMIDFLVIDLKREQSAFRTRT